MTTRILLAAALACAALPARAEGDPDHGREIFQARCTICHSAEPGRNKIGPSLYAVVGRPAGSVPDYAYSDANKRSGIVWDRDTIERYLAAPQAMVPGTKMTFPGLKNPEDRASVVAFLATLTGRQAAR